MKATGYIRVERQIRQVDGGKKKKKKTSLLHSAWRCKHSLLVSVCSDREECLHVCLVSALSLGPYPPHPMLPHAGGYMSRLWSRQQRPVILTPTVSLFSL